MMRHMMRVSNMLLLGLLKKNHQTFLMRASTSIQCKMMMTVALHCSLMADPPAWRHGKLAVVACLAVGCMAAALSHRFGPTALEERERHTLYLKDYLPDKGGRVDGARHPFWTSGAGSGARPESQRLMASGAPDSSGRAGVPMPGRGLSESQQRLSHRETRGAHKQNSLSAHHQAGSRRRFGMDLQETVRFGMDLEESHELVRALSEQRLAARSGPLGEAMSGVLRRLKDDDQVAVALIKLESESTQRAQLHQLPAKQRAVEAAAAAATLKAYERQEEALRAQASQQLAATPEVSHYAASGERIASSLKSHATTMLKRRSYGDPGGSPRYAKPTRADKQANKQGLPHARMHPVSSSCTPSSRFLSHVYRSRR